jgi:ATP-dependent helicase/nuclease subunit A
LRKSINSEKLSDFIAKRLESDYTDEYHQKLINDISNDLQKFYESDEFKFINSFQNYRNEFEAYLKEEDFYLFGILDKLIIGEKKMMIIDYKTDNVDENQINKRSERYLPQLRFYAYIVSRLFSKSSHIEGRLVFIKHPDKSFVFNYDDNADRQIKSNLSILISAIRSNNYSLNLNACDDCIFSLDKSQCINNNSGIN